MNIVLLSGGSGKRLWPLSNEIRSKQFLRLFRTEQGYESMIQRVYRQLVNVDSDCTITIATSRAQVSSIHNQLGDKVGISIEPCRRDTFPAIALACAYLHDIQGVGTDEPVVVCPVDPYVQEDYFAMLKALGEQADRGEANLVLMGIAPLFPSEKYGYIIPEQMSAVSAVRCFKEKPAEAVAREYIRQGALWNGGVFAFRLRYVLDIAQRLLGSREYRWLYSHYAELPKISFDYAVVEKESSIQVMRYMGQWMDLGSWNTLTDAMSDQLIGNAYADETCQNVHIINELDVPILAMGLKNAVISASPDGILVADKDRSGYLKDYVDRFSDGEVRFAEKSWGDFRVIDAGPDSLTIHVNIRAKDHMNYHSHDHRDEVWVITSGRGRTIVDGVECEVGPGDVILMKAGCRHTIHALTDVDLIEVQLGKEISAHDKHKHPMGQFVPL